MLRFNRYSRWRRFGAALLCSGALLGGSRAEVRLPAVISDGLVLQRDVPATLWGWADPGEPVRVRFRDEEYQARADRTGAWSVSLTPQAAGGPFALEIEGGNSIQLNDVHIGDVWLCSGQSNMELPMERVKEKYAAVIAESENPQIRYFGVNTAYDFDAPRPDVESEGWKAANPQTVLGFGAVGYFFARALLDHLNVPIGIINASVGGSPLQAWLSEQALEKYPEELAEARRWRNDELIAQTEAANEAIYADWEERARTRDAGINADPPWYDPGFEPEDWPLMTLPTFWDEGGLEPMNGVAWFRRSFRVPTSLAGRSGMLYLGTIVDADETYLNGVKVGSTTYQYPPRRYQVPAGLLEEGENVIVIRAFSHSGRGSFTRDKPFHLVVGERSIDLRGEWRYKVGAVLEARPATTFIRWNPLGLYNAMIAPLTPMRLTGILWYQDESNTSRPGNYKELLTTLVADWRSQWNQEELPFIWVQLANFMETRDAPAESDWARLRDEQRRALEIPKTGMAVAIDVGEWNDIHPLNKKAVGERLALEARRVAYGEDSLVSAGPLLESARRMGERVRLTFDHVGGALVARGGGQLEHFAIAGEDGRFVRAEARIVGDEVEVWSEEVKRPTAVRYAWADNPESANLYNKEGLPASPFEVKVD